ncbi:PepSY domain-containing protein [Ruegeria sp. HKCCC2117]|uniref:PepSY-associated TM helix domain-containing protein n=1 Tax=Ruegeria sp. HKCCC2117 TaxID=2682992 RepID=UPI00148778A4|nr:PepSY-associated TM helix domain-containing protein [Ruegeria sp. HKCCC2117]
MNRKLRNLLFTLHTWLGLHFAIFFFFLFLTGSLLVIGVELESVGRPAVWTTAAKEDRTASFGEIYSNIKEVYPESVVQTITKRPTPWFVDRSEGRTGWGEQVNYWTDPETAEVVQVTRYPGFDRILRELHVKLLSGQSIIYKAVAATSIVVLFQIISGLITYRRFWKGFFRRPRQGVDSRSWAGAMHRLTAVWTAPFLIISAVTAFFFMLSDFGIDGFRPKPEPSVERETRLPPDFGAAILDQAEARAREALPGFEPQSVALPVRKSDGLSFSGHLPSIPEIRGPSIVTVDPVTFEVLGAFTPYDNTHIARWRHVIDELHYGYWGGIFSRGLWIVLGLVATGVAFTGALIFATRLTSDAAQYGPLRRIWRGLGIFRWAYVLLVLGVLAGGYVNYGPISYKRAGILPEKAPASLAYLVLDDPLRRGTPIDVELRIGAPEVDTASVEINGRTAQSLTVTPAGQSAHAYFQLDPADSSNDVIVQLVETNGRTQTITFRLGQPIW